MSSLLLPRRFYSQPQGAVHIDFNSPYAKGLLHVSGGADIGGFKAVNGPVLTPITTAKFPGAALGVKFTSASSQHLIADAKVTAFPLTFLVIANRGSVGANQSFMCIGAGTNDRHVLYATANDELALFSGAGGTTGQAISAVGTLGSTSEVYSMCGVVSGANRRDVYLNGVNVGTNTTTVTPNIASKIVVSGLYSTGAMVSGFYANGNVIFAGAWDRALNLDEIISIQRNPWQLFKVSE